MHITESDGLTVLTGTIADQAALHGLLARIRDLGLPLISLQRITADHENPADPGLRRSGQSHRRRRPSTRP
jgi:hypothetical protein